MHEYKASDLFIQFARTKSDADISVAGVPLLEDPEQHAEYTASMDYGSDCYHDKSNDSFPVEITIKDGDSRQIASGLALLMAENGFQVNESALKVHGTRCPRLCIADYTFVDKLPDGSVKITVHNPPPLEPDEQASTQDNDPALAF